MSFAECFKSAIKNVFSNKMRTFLTMLGIIIGISSVIMVVAIGNGSQAQIEEEFETFGAGTIEVNLVSSRDIETRDLLSMEDYTLLKSLEGIKYVNPVYKVDYTNIKLLDPRETKSANVTGVTSDNKFITNPTILYGRYISDNDVDMRTNVCVINDTTAIKVFGYCNENIIGQKISIKTWKGSNKFTVVGVLENSNTSENTYSDEFPESIFIPISTAMKLKGYNNLSGFTVLPEDSSKTSEISDLIIETLSKAHGNSDKYYISDASDMVDSITSILSSVTLFISFVAGIALLVGGIGVMNIMMVTVTERTREIGIRKSIGAKNKDIRVQFITEAIILTGMGGAVGLIIGWMGALIIGKYAGVTPVMDITSIIAAVGISTAIGIIFGVAPANKAAVMDPIEALRYE